MFNEIEKLKPYFRSVRDLDGKVCFDIIIPSKWKFLEHINETTSTLVQQTDNVNTLLTIISVNDEDGYKSAYNATSSIIKFNVEEAEKEELFNKKILELQELFKRESLDSLKDLLINI